MDPHSISPRNLCARLAPGQLTTARVELKSQTSTTMTASIEGGDGAVSLSQIVVFRLIRRPPTQQEIEDLPPVPPSLRERLIREGVEDELVSAQMDGDVPVNVPAGSTARFELALAAPPIDPGRALTGILVIEGIVGTVRVEVPVVILVGVGSARPDVVFGRESDALAPGESEVHSLSVEKAPTSAIVVVRIVHRDPATHSMIRLKFISARTPVRKFYTPEELEELPAFPPSIREEAARNGYFDYKETARAQECEPLPVRAGQLVYGQVEFLVPADDFPDYVNALLSIYATTWEHVDLQLHITVAEMTFELSTTSLAVRQGSSEDMSIDIDSVAGPDTVAQLGIGTQYADRVGDWRVEPSSVLVPRHGLVHRPIKVFVAPDTLAIAHPTSFDLSAFDGLLHRFQSFELTVLPGRVIARVLQSLASGAPGSTVTCMVELATEGGFHEVTFTLSSPPSGVQMAPVTVDVHYTQPPKQVAIPLTISSSAPLVDDATVGIRWTSNDGAGEGVLYTKIDIAWPFESRKFNRTITTPSGTALGGTTELTVRSDGTWTFTGHMHNRNGFDPYAFRVGVVLRAPDGRTCVAALKSGTVGGTLDSTPRDYYWTENSAEPNVMLRTLWGGIRSATADFSVWYEDTGILGTLEDIAVAVAEFLAITVVAGPGVAAAIVIGSELGALTEIPFLHPTILAGVFAAAGIVMILGPGMIVPAVVAGIAALVEVDARQLRPSEKREAERVFGDTLPVDRILITNFDRGGRAFCMPHVDGSILVCLGDRYDDPLATGPAANTFIHELTHAWQIARRPEVATLLIEAAINDIRGDDATYTEAPLALDGRPWGEYGIERQAQIVDTWYDIAALHRAMKHPGNPRDHSLDVPEATAMTAFHYIQNNIRMGIA